MPTPTPNSERKSHPMSNPLFKTITKEQSNSIIQSLTASLISSIESLLSKKIHLRILNSQVTHEVLEPEGDTFRIAFTVEIHPRKEKIPE
jgi:hypothetical protein